MKKIILVGIGLILGFTLSLTTPNVNAYGEKEGGWSSSEKRQVISLLQQIAKNTK